MNVLDWIRLGQYMVIFTKELVKYIINLGIGRWTKKLIHLSGGYFFEIMEKDILPKDLTLTEIAKTIRNVSEETIYRVHSGKNYYWPVLSMAIYKTVVKTQSTKQENKPSEKQKERPNTE